MRPGQRRLIMKHHSQEEIKEMRLAFNSGTQLGLIEQIVIRELEKNPDLKIDSEAIAEFYEVNRYPNIAKFTRFSTKIGLEQIASNNIDLLGVANGPMSLENMMSLQGIRIGYPKRGISVLAWLAYLSTGFKELSTLQAEAFDSICGTFARLEDGKEVEVLGF